MKNLFCWFLVFAIAIPAFAEKQKIDFGVTGHAPTVKGGTGANDFNKEIDAAFQEVIKEINKQFNEIEFASPQKLLQAMGDASVFASHGATTRGYGGYKVFSATIGPTFGLQLPTSIASIMNDMNNLSDSLEKEGDIKLGVNPNIINVHFGLNMGIFKMDNLYLGLRVGYFNLPNISGLNFNTFTLGATANYQILPSINLAGLVTWRGVSLGSGLIYNNSKISFAMPLGDDPIDQEIGTGQGRIYMKPEASLNLNVNTITIPLEAITSIKLLIFNIPFGIGADIAFGKTSLGFGVTSDMELRDLPPGYSLDKNGDISVKAGTSNSPSFFNFKIMTGFGLVMGPVILDVPITYYPASGYNFGITIGAVF